VFVWSTAGRTERVEAMIGRRTEELRQVNNVLENQIEQSIILEDELLRKTSEFQQIFNTTPAMLWVKDADGRFILVNRAAAATAGRPVREIVGRTDHEVYPRFAARYVADDREVIATGEAKLGIEEPHEMDTGEVRWLRTDKLPFRNETHEIVGVIIVATDITDRVEAEQALRESDERLTLALRASGIGTWNWDINRQRITWDKFIAPLFGLESDNFHDDYDAFLNRLHPDDRPRVEHEVRAAMDDDAEYDTEFRVIWPNGEEHTLASRGRVYRDGVGQPIRMTGVFFDVTEAQRAEQQLRESEQRFRQLAENISEVFWITSADGRQMIYVSPAYQTIWGRPVQTVMDDAEAWVKAIHENDRARVGRAFFDGAREGRFDEEYRIVRPDGEIRWVRDRGFPVRDTTGKVVRITGIAHDITERKRAAEVLARQAERLFQANEELKRSNEELDSFAYIASHDLKEPLRGLSNYATFLIEDYADKLDDTGREYLQSLARLCERMDNLIDSLLYYSRVGRTELAVEQVDLNAILNEVIDRLKPSLEPQGVDVRVPRPLPTIRCDHVRVGEVFANLITNAAKYNESVPKWVEIGYYASREPLPAGDNTPALTGTGLVFYVRDNGIGIPDDRHHAVFEMFRRLHGRERFGGGTGAGLTIVQKIIRRHGGQVWIESQADVGTTFYFTLGGNDDGE